MILYGDRRLCVRVAFLFQQKSNLANLTTRNLIWFVFKTTLQKQKKSTSKNGPGFVQAARSRELDRPRRGGAA